MSDLTERAENETADNDIFGGDLETKKEVLEIELKKTRAKLFTIAFVVFLFDFIAIARLDAVHARSMMIIAVVPLIMVGLAFLAMKEPLAAMILATLIIGGIWVYTVIKFGTLALVAGWLAKVILIYLMIAGFQNATEAQRIKKELKT